MMAQRPKVATKTSQQAQPYLPNLQKGPQGLGYEQASNPTVTSTSGESTVSPLTLNSFNMLQHVILDIADLLSKKKIAKQLSGVTAKSVVEIFSMHEPNTRRRAHWYKQNPGQLGHHNSTRFCHWTTCVLVPAPKLLYYEAVKKNLTTYHLENHIQGERPLSFKKAPPKSSTAAKHQHHISAGQQKQTSKKLSRLKTPSYQTTAIIPTNKQKETQTNISSTNRSRSRNKHAY